MFWESAHAPVSARSATPLTASEDTLLQLYLKTHKGRRFLLDSFFATLGSYTPLPGANLRPWAPSCQRRP